MSKRTKIKTVLNSETKQLLILSHECRTIDQISIHFSNSKTFETMFKAKDLFDIRLNQFLTKEKMVKNFDIEKEKSFYISFKKRSFIENEYDYEDDQFFGAIMETLKREFYDFDKTEIMQTYTVKSTGDRFSILILKLDEFDDNDLLFIFFLDVNNAHVENNTLYVKY